MRTHLFAATASLVLLAACGTAASGGVSANDLAAAFEADPASAVTKYASPVTVSGEVASVEGTAVQLKTKSMRHKVHAQLASGTVKDGANVTLVCTQLAAQGRDAMLSGCTPR